LNFAHKRSLQPAEMCNAVTDSGRFAGLHPLWLKSQGSQGAEKAARQQLLLL
jgi:hypothetical protein